MVVPYNYNKKNYNIHKQINTKLSYLQNRWRFSLLKLLAVDWDKISNGIEFHKNVVITKKECLNTLTADDTRRNIKECDLVANILNSK